jgi:hypothetical protein
VSVRLDCSCEVGHKGSPGEVRFEGEEKLPLLLTSTAKCKFKRNADSKIHVGHLTFMEMNILSVMSR